MKFHTLAPATMAADTTRSQTAPVDPAPSATVPLIAEPIDCPTTIAESSIVMTEALRPRGLRAAARLKSVTSDGPMPTPESARSRMWSCRCLCASCIPKFSSPALATFLSWMLCMPQSPWSDGREHLGAPTETGGFASVVSLRWKSNSRIESHLSRPVDDE